MPEFIPGLELCRLFYCEEVRPILADAFPDLRYSAARIGSGSDVLGFDTEMSTDHDWGPGLLLFLQEADLRRSGEAIRETLSLRLPPSFRGFPTRYVPNTDGTLTLAQSSGRGAQHRVDVRTIPAFIEEYLGFDIDAELHPADWLSFPEQKLLGLTAGAVFHDDLELAAVRRRFAYYPRDVWLYLLAAGWNRIGQEEHLMGRAGFVGDDLGSALIGARLVRDLMRLCFLMEQRYAPYPKWFGTAFRQLSCGPRLEPLLLRAVRAETWRDREAALVVAYEIIASMQNDLGLTAPVPATAGRFHNRPFRVIHLGADFSAALCRRIEDPVVKEIASRRPLGSVDQVSDNTDLLCGAEWRGVVRSLFTR